MESLLPFMILKTASLSSVLLVEPDQRTNLCFSLKDCVIKAFGTGTSLKMQFPTRIFQLKYVISSNSVFFLSFFFLQGNDLHWLACALYVACRKSVPTVSKGTVEGNYVSLTRILRCSEQR